MALEGEETLFEFGYQPVAKVGWQRKMGTARTATNPPPRSCAKTKTLSVKRIGWLYPIFRDLHFYHGLLGRRNRWA